MSAKKCHDLKPSHFTKIKKIDNLQRIDISVKDPNGFIKCSLGFQLRHKMKMREFQEMIVWNTGIPSSKQIYKNKEGNKLIFNDDDTIEEIFDKYYDQFISLFDEDEINEMNKKKNNLPAIKRQASLHIMEIDDVEEMNKEFNEKMDFNNKKTQ